MFSAIVIGATPATVAEIALTPTSVSTVHVTDAVPVASVVLVAEASVPVLVAFAHVTTAPLTEAPLLFLTDTRTVRLEPTWTDWPPDGDEICAAVVGAVLDEHAARQEATSNELSRTRDMGGTSQEKGYPPKSTSSNGTPARRR